MSAATEIAVDRRIPRWAVPLTKPKRYKGASGGRGSGKSHLFAEEAVERMVCDPALSIVCIREVQKSLEFSVRKLVVMKIRELAVAECFAVFETEIRRVGGSGVMIFQGMQDHTAESIKSLEGFGVAWIEEAQTISQESIDLLLPTIRAEGSEIWFSWNPRRKTDPVDVMFSSGLEGSIRVHSTYLDNPFLPQTLRDEAERYERAEPEKFPHVWLGKYEMGGKGRIYLKFVEKPFPEGNVDASVRDHGGEIYVGQDFNVNPMASIIAVRYADECHVIDALLVGTSNTEEVCQEIATRYPGRVVIFCPDPAGNARSTSAKAGVTDFTIIRSFGFEVRAPRAHPPVADRINNMNMMLCDQHGRRRMRIHPRATALIESLSAQVYKKDTNIPDKTSGYDHPNDAAGYLAWQEFNIATDEAPSWGSASFRS